MLSSYRIHWGKVDILIGGTKPGPATKDRRQSEEPESKILRARTKEEPDEDLIAHWQREIEIRKQQVARLTRRLKLEWQDS